MRITSWNVNGLRSLYLQGYWKWFGENAPDILCLQEIKSEVAQLAPDVQKIEGYFSYFNSSRARKGYSGVAIYTKKEPKEVKYDVLPAEFNEEGRLIEATFDDFVLLNVYFPNGGRSPERLDYKLRYYDAFLEYVTGLKNEGKTIIFCGDVNVAHEEIDLACPRENQDHTGFLPEERAWVDEVVNAGFVDIFRHLYPNKVLYTYWDQITRARDRNIGWRLDYFFATSDLLSRVTDCRILNDVYGSDHCPVEMEISA
ncbi:MAG: exodeoxyribonuclease III [Patescibacteria group bacterium]